MRTKAGLILLLFIAVVVLGGCAPEPKEVVDAYYRYIISEEYDTAYRLLSKESRGRVSEDEFTEVWRYNTAENQLIDYGITGYGTEGDRAIVAVTLRANDGYSTFSINAEVSLVKEGANWRIVLSETFGKNK